MSAKVRYPSFLISSEVTIETEAGAWVTFCSYREAPETVSIGISGSASRGRSARELRGADPGPGSAHQLVGALQIQKNITSGRPKANLPSPGAHGNREPKGLAAAS
jgi:hypothetical protein